LALRASHSGPVVRRDQPGVPGLFPLRTCLTPLTCRRCGGCKRPHCCCSAWSFSGHCPSGTCCGLGRACIGGSPILLANENRRFVIRSGHYFNAHGAGDHHATRRWSGKVRRSPTLRLS
jgi:hypothetical protein